jgi:hypothetical protein
VTRPAIWCASTSHRPCRRLDTLEYNLLVAQRTGLWTRSASMSYNIDREKPSTPAAAAPASLGARPQVKRRIVSVKRRIVSAQLR